MCTLAVDLQAICREHGVTHDPFTAEREKLAGMAKDGLVLLEGPGIRVTEAGRPFVRLIAAAFDVYLTRGGQRHSRAF
jgi:oxygen-independent coproporphyrinogen-3 oxidase